MEAPRLTKVRMHFQSASVCSWPIRIGGARITIIGESDIVPNKNIILQSHPFTNKGMTGNFAAVPNLDPFLNLHKRSNLHIVPNLTSVKIDEIVKPDIFAQFHIGGYPLKQML